MSLIQTLFTYADPTDLAHSPSFNDFSLHVGQQITEAEEIAQVEEPTTPTTTGVLPPLVSTKSEPLPKRVEATTQTSKNIVKDVWPELAYGKSLKPSRVKSLGRDFYDFVPDRKRAPTTYDMIIQSEQHRMKALQQEEEEYGMKIPGLPYPNVVFGKEFEKAQQETS
eukprot:TRINITY_DN3091_c0_g1_i5.p1 TRINITY_DN3091_c0_g1~~TRINITY_DN3091_c0_g1_i5.p1  ORF type:complete len:167 (+),score=27.62 TRINITY_DN3091_c0_g1_i5:58-558(+)